MRSLLSAFVALAPSVPLLAQSMTLSAPAAASVSAQAGASQQTAPLPAGPLSSQGNISANAGGICNADLLWSASQSATGLELFLTATASVANSPAHATVGPLDLLVSVSSPSSMPVAFTLTRTVFGSPGTTMPFARVDVGDDGTFELDETTTAPVEVVTMVGPTPVLLRCRIGADAAVTGLVLSSLRVSGRPGATAVSSLQPGCIDNFVVSPRFDGNLEFWINSSTAAASVAVFGLTTQPLLLGSAPQYPGGPLVPCLLLPSPEFIVFLPSLQPQLLVVPPGARPIAIYSQAVHVLPLAQPTTTFSTSTAFQIFAF